MNQTQSEGTSNPFDQLKGKFKSSWTLLSDQDIALFTSGKVDQFYDILEEKEGVGREEAKEKIQEFAQACGCTHAAA